MKKLLGTYILPDSQPNIEGACLNILVAEDEPSNQFLLEKILQRSGHHVTIASNGEEALKLLNNNAYDIGIFDMQMPVMSGIEAIEKYRENKEIRDLPFIILTANNKDEVMKECKNIGIEIILTKPVSSENLLESINRACNNIYEHDE